MMFLLNMSQQFKKYISSLQVGELEEAVKYGRNRLAKFFGLPGFEELVQVLSKILLIYSFFQNLKQTTIFVMVQFFATRFIAFSEFLPLFLSVQDCVALLAYEQPQKSQVGYLLDDSQREIVADAVNAMILQKNPKPMESGACLHSELERMLRQLTVCCLVKRQSEGDQGEAFHLHRVLSSSQ